MTPEEIAGKLTKRERLDLRRYIRGSSICRTSGKRLVELGLIIPARFVGGRPIDADYVSPLGLAVAAALRGKE